MTVELDKVRAICERVAASLGLEIVEIEFRGGAGRQGRVLRIFIDKAGQGQGDSHPGSAAMSPLVPGAQTSDSDGSAAGNLAETSSPTPSPEVMEGVAESGAGGLGVTLEDCANLSREVSTILDVEDAVPGAEYVLEVSSPGLDRKLNTAADFERFVGSRVKLMTREPVGVTEKSKGNRHFEGRLEKFTNGRLWLDVSPAKKGKPKPGKKHLEIGSRQPVEIEFRNVEKANLVPEI